MLLALVSIFLLLFSSVYSYSNVPGSYSNEGSFIQMVLSNITASENYVLPTDNRKLTYVSDKDKNKRHDYGTFDFIIIGGGTAGTLLANRLSEIKKWKILLLEAGGPENDFTDIPGMSYTLYFSDKNWGYYTVPQKTACFGMIDNKCVAPRGKVLGGCSTINDKMYVRGNKEDYDNWERMGNEGWSYEHVLPYFIKTENTSIDNGDLNYHGEHGLLHVNYTEPTIFTSVYLKGMEDLGYEVLDYNGRRQIGTSRVQLTINGIKIASGGRAFIQPILYRKNLNVTLKAFVTKLLINETAKFAYGVEFIKDGKIYTANALKEVILSAGAINSPQILMISGIGPKEELDRIGVKTIIDLPVGKRMQDHAHFVGLDFQTNVTIFNHSIPILLHNYLKGHRPYTAPSNIDATSFFNVHDKHSKVPTIQHIFVVPLIRGQNNNFNGSYDTDLVSTYSDIFIGVALLRPKSKGSVTLKSKNPLDFPNIDYNYFSDPEGEDIYTVYKGILETLRLLKTDPFKSINAKYIRYMQACTDLSEGSKDYWYCLIRSLTTTLYHPVGTTLMGISKKDSVVSSKLVVHGMKRLRIVDAGVIPEIPSGNTMAPTYMIAEKAADFCRVLPVT